MNSNLQLVKSAQFNGIQFDCYAQDGQQDNSDFWATRTQIGQLLEYEEPMKAVAKIHERNQERLDKFSTIVNLTTVEGSRTVTRDLIVYNFKGLLEICRYSNQPKANAVMDFLWNIADEIRRTGSYNTKSHLEDLQTKNRELDIRGAELLKSMLNMSHMTAESKTVFTHEIYRLISGHENLAMLPELKEARYSATELGKKFGVTANKIGRIAKDNGLKSKQGESNEYGTWICSKSRNSNHECPVFVYNDNAVSWFKKYFNE